MSVRTFPAEDWNQEPSPEYQNWNRVPPPSQSYMDSPRPGEWAPGMQGGQNPGMNFRYQTEPYPRNPAGGYSQQPGGAGYAPYQTAQNPYGTCPPAENREEQPFFASPEPEPYYGRGPVNPQAAYQPGYAENPWYTPQPAQPDWQGSPYPPPYYQENPYTARRQQGWSPYAQPQPSPYSPGYAYPPGNGYDSQPQQGWRTFQQESPPPYAGTGMGGPNRGQPDAYSQPSVPDDWFPQRNAGAGYRSAQPGAGQSREDAFPQNRSRYMNQDESMYTGTRQESAAPPAPGPAAGAAEFQQDGTGSRRRRRSRAMMEQMGEAAPAADYEKIMEDTEDVPVREKKKRRASAGRREKEGRETGSDAGKQKNRMALRLVWNLLMFLLVSFLALEGIGGEVLPAFLKEPSHLLWAMVLMTALSAAGSSETVAAGLAALFGFRPNGDACAAAAVTAALIQGGCAAMRPDLWMNSAVDLFLPAAALSLVLNTAGKLIESVRMEETERLVSGPDVHQVMSRIADRKLARACTENNISDPIAVTKTSFREEISSLSGDASSPGRVEGAARSAAFLTVVASAAVCLFLLIMGRGIYDALGSLAACLCLALPASCMITSQLPLFLTNGLLAKWKAGVSGYEAAEDVAGADVILMKESDLFPERCAVIRYCHLVGTREPDRPILEGAAMVNATSGCLRGIFDSSIPDKSMIPRAENLKVENGLGFSAWIQGHHVLLGDRRLMMRYHITPISEEEEEKLCEKENTDVLYLASGGEICAVLLIYYQVDRPVYQALGLLSSRNIGICVESTNPNLSVDRIAAMYDFPQELMSALPFEALPAAANAGMQETAPDSGVFCDGSMESGIQAVAGADTVVKNSRWQTAVMLFSVILGFTIAVFCAVSDSMSSLSWLAAVVYQLFWLLIGLVLTLLSGNISEQLT